MRLLAFWAFAVAVMALARWKWFTYERRMARTPDDPPFWEPRGTVEMASYFLVAAVVVLPGMALLSLAGTSDEAVLSAFLPFMGLTYVACTLVSRRWPQLRLPENRWAVWADALRSRR